MHLFSDIIHLQFLFFVVSAALLAVLEQLTLHLMPVNNMHTNAFCRIRTIFANVLGGRESYSSLHPCMYTANLMFFLFYVID